MISTQRLRVNAMKVNSRRTSDICTPRLRGVVKSKDPPVRKRHPLDLMHLFLFLMLLNVNLRFPHVYTLPPNICLYPPNFKFLEITLRRTSINAPQSSAHPPNTALAVRRTGATLAWLTTSIKDQQRCRRDYR